MWERKRGWKIPEPNEGLLGKPTNKMVDFRKKKAMLDYRWVSSHLLIQWEIQDPKMEVLYHIRPYFLRIFPYIGLINRPYIW
jgi:hypothetical protein